MICISDFSLYRGGHKKRQSSHNATTARPQHAAAPLRIRQMPRSMLSTAALLLCSSAVLSAPPQDSSRAGSDQVKKIMETYGGRGVLRDDTPPSSPQEAVKKFKVRDGLAIDIMATEPDVEQPLYMSWD